MDFAKKLIQQENVVTKSGIRILPIPAKTDDDEDQEKKKNDPPTTNNVEEGKPTQNKLDRMHMQAANTAAIDLLTSSGSNVYSTNKKAMQHKAANDTNEEEELDSELSKLIDCKLYPTQVLPSSSAKIMPSSLVVIFESFDSLNFVYAKSGDIFNNRNGAFHHDDFIGKPFGCKIRSRSHRGLGFVYLLKPTPELWARSLNHRTQIVHELDASMVVFHLNLKPNMVVCESGTGSGAMSHAMIRAIAPYGTLHTYEFNEMRVKTARDEFKSNGVGHLVNVHWRDVCGKPNSGNNNSTQQGKEKSCDDKEQKEDKEEVMGSGGFDIGKSAADAIFLDLPEPWLAIPYAAETLKSNGRICSYSPCVEQSQKTVQAMTAHGFHSVRTCEVRLREHYVDEVTLSKVPTEKLPKQQNVNPYVPGAPSPTPESSASQSSVQKDDSALNTKASSANSTSPSPTNGVPAKKRKILCARPFAKIKGHTAFLTFANAGNKKP